LQRAPAPLAGIYGTRPACFERMKTDSNTLRKRDFALYKTHFQDEERETWRDHSDTFEERTAARVRSTTKPIDVWASDRELVDLARRRADLMIDWVCALREPLTLTTINGWLEGLEAAPMEYKGQHSPQSHEKQLQAMVKRLGCELYWRRQLRRAQVRKREAQEQAKGNICARVMPYCHDVTDARHKQRQAANRAMLEGTEIESADGEIITLWDAVQASTANKAIRRGELMTRIRGCEEWADKAGMVGIFTTNTLPSRFHASLFGGGKNPNFDGSTPRDGQGWLSKTWARARAKINRQKIKVFGFRVAEPHHDGCPHWHMLLWVSASQVQQLAAVLRDCWLQHEGDEYGAQEYRFKAVAIDKAKGGAIAYVAKYIAKNIDDCGAVEDEGHEDHYMGQKELLTQAKAQRVTAWASAWGIRQFQPVGQPPVTVWRELRRIDAGMAAGGSKRLQRAHAAVHKGEDKGADWCAYMTEQGGAMTGRGYQLRIEFDHETTEGRYGLVEVARPAGVFDVARPGELCTSTRKQWKPKGSWTPSERHAVKVGSFAEVASVSLYFEPTWTRFNNCTHPAPKVRRRDENTYQLLTHGGSKTLPLRYSGKKPEKKSHVPSLAIGPSDQP